MLLLPKTYSHPSLPISGLQKIGDLINLQGPILSLFRDDNNKYYLYYWIDSTDTDNRWLVWKVNHETLYHYLQAEISLLDVIRSEEKDYFFIIDIDGELNYQNVFPIELKLIPSDYLPETKSFFKMGLPEFALQFIDEYENSSNYYKVLMKRNSIIFNISPSETNFSRAVTTQDAGGFLSRLTRSLNGFIEERFWAKYRDIIPSSSDYNKFLNQVKQILAPRLFGLKFGSFEVSVGVDIVKKVELEDFAVWQKQILPEFQKDVVDIDYSNLDQLQNLSLKYSETAREKIYNPYIQIINSTHYQFVIKDKADKIIKTYRKIEKSKEDILVPVRKEVEYNLPKEKKLLSLIVEMSEGQTVDELNKKLLQSGLLFSQQVSDLQMFIENASNGIITIYFKSPVAYTFAVNNNIYSAFLPDLSLYIENVDKNALLNNLETEIVTLYNLSVNNDESDPIKVYFDKIVKKIEVNPDDLPF